MQVISVKTAIQARPRWRWWIAVVALASIILLVVAAASRHTEFSFLEDLGPSKVYDPGAPSSLPGPESDFRYQLVYFSKNRSAAVLAALKRHLTPARGYTMDRNDSEKGAFITFGYGKSPHDRGAIFTNESEFPSRWGGRIQAPNLEPGGCVVVLAFRPNWWEKKWQEFRQFLHLG